MLSINEKHWLETSFSSYGVSLQISHLFSGPLESCHSSLLAENGKGLHALLLTLVGLKVSVEICRQTGSTFSLLKYDPRYTTCCVAILCRWSDLHVAHNYVPALLRRHIKNHWYLSKALDLNWIGQNFDEYCSQRDSVVKCKLNIPLTLNMSPNTSNFTCFWQLCSTVEELKQFMQNTLLFVQSELLSVDIDKQLETSLESLQQLGHVTISSAMQKGKIEVTHLGQATFKGC